MDCEHAVALISARLDHEIQPDDFALLERHLADCSDCRATAEAFVLQHGDMQRAFEPRRAAAATVAEQVNAQLASTRTVTPAAPARTPLLQHTWARVSLVAGGVAAALAFLLTWLHRPPQERQIVQVLDNTSLRDVQDAPASPSRLQQTWFQNGQFGERKCGMVHQAQ